MSIATELEALNTNIKNAYNAIDTKGGTIPQNKNMVNLTTAIASIPSGGSRDDNWDEVFSGESTQLYDANITSLRAFALLAPSTSYTFLTSINFPDALRIIERHAFAGCSALSEIITSDRPCFYKIEDGVFMDCPQLERVNGKVVVAGYCFD